MLIHFLRDKVLSNSVRIRGCSFIFPLLFFVMQLAHAISGVPNSPSINSSQIENGNWSVAWGSVAGTTRYELQESALSGPWGIIYDGDLLQEAVSDKAVAGEYRYRVRACDGSGSADCSAYSNESSYLFSVVSESSILVTNVSGNGDVTLSWPKSDWLNIFWSLQAYQNGSWQTVLGAPFIPTGGSYDAVTDRVSWTQTGLANGEYYYRIKYQSAGCFWGYCWNVDQPQQSRAVTVVNTGTAITSISAANRAAFVMPVHDETVGAVGGQHQVGQDGSANYSIPISIPPGRAGMAFELWL